MSAILEPSTGLVFDYQRPDYNSAIAQRMERLKRIRAQGLWPALKVYYADHPIEFMNHWAMSFDPRNPEVGLPAVTPFLPFAKQQEWVLWVLDLWRGQQSGVSEKSRESGMSWLMIWFSIWLCMFHRGIVVGVGSRKEEYVDLRGAMKSLFEKARFALSHLPPELLDGFDPAKHAPHMRI
jgi:phage terminase large subunit